jgi:hypothetical protein
MATGERKQRFIRRSREQILKYASSPRYAWRAETAGGTRISVDTWAHHFAEVTYHRVHGWHPKIQELLQSLHVNLAHISYLSRDLLTDSDGYGVRLTHDANNPVEREVTFVVHRQALTRLTAAMIDLDLDDDVALQTFYRDARLAYRSLAKVTNRRDQSRRANQAAVGLGVPITAEVAEQRSVELDEVERSRAAAELAAQEEREQKTQGGVVRGSQWYISGEGDGQTIVRYEWWRVQTGRWSVKVDRQEYGEVWSIGNGWTHTGCEHIIVAKQRQRATELLLQRCGFPPAPPWPGGDLEPSTS